MASIHKSGERYKVRWRNPDGSQGSRIVPSRKVAAQLVRQVEEAHALRRPWPDPAERTARRPALDDVAERYIREQAPGWSARTLRVRAYQLEVWGRFCAEAGHHDAGALSRAVMAEYFAWLTSSTGRHGQPRARSTARKYLGLVERMWRWAADAQEEIEGWDGQIPRARRISDQVRLPAGEWRPAPTWEEMQRAIGAADGWLRCLFVALYYTGLRVDQAMRLRREDLDLERRVLHVRPELGKSTSEQAGRAVPVSDHLVAWARALPAVEGGWLLPWTRRRPRPSMAVAAWRRSEVREATWKGRPHHAFRAGFYSGLRRAGAALDVVEFLVGHAPGRAVQPYLDPDALPLRSAVELIPHHEGDAP